MLELVPEAMRGLQKESVELILPSNFVCSSKCGGNGGIKYGDMSTGVPRGFLGLDTGLKSIEPDDAANTGFSRGQSSAWSSNS